MRKVPSRRSFLQGMAVAALAAPSVGRAQSQQSVTFFSPAVWTDPRLLGDFTRETGIPIQVQTYADIDQMTGRIRATGGSGVDVVMCPNNFTQEFYSAGLFQPIETQRLQNWNALYPNFRDASFLSTELANNSVGVPLVWGPEGLIYRTDKITEANAWSDLWNSEWRGRISSVNNGFQMIQMAAQVLGYKDELSKDIMEFTDEQYDAIKAHLLQQKPLVSKYWNSTAEGASLLINGEVWISLGRIAMLQSAREEKTPVKLIAPKEGAQGWCNNMCLTKGEPNDAKYKFLDWMISSSYQSKLSATLKYPGVNEEVMNTLPADLRNDLMLGDPNITSTLVWWKQAGSPQRINNLWNEVKAS